MSTPVDAALARDEGSDVLLDWPNPGVALVTLNRPAKLNAITHATIEELLATLASLSEDPTCSVVVITGAGRAFCAGMDIGATVANGGAQPPQPKSIPQRFDGQELFAAMPRTIRMLRQPVIAAVNGAAAGAGMGIALAADVRVAAQSAVFHIAAVRLGLSAGECGISYHLPRLIGASKAAEYMLTGRPISSDAAERLGLVADVVPDGEAVDAALAVAAEICMHSPFSVRQTKAVLRENVDNSFEAAIAVENRTQILALATEDAAEAIRAFTEKRPADYTGR
ncbi:enoyl-CoA hydratase/isomerase family protein [Mycolicibacterium sp. XJ1819]